ncbi:type VI secretion system contractile sheath small subunit [Pseudomonas sp. CDFA 602]|uniref:type VI secretion system contractile sheath small subunit n=1 Tax=Pseudomonas californiensis TaxID=2829823 RepID=UPI001E381A0A|nr:type VI secretion system contractile sheath small subunit [Pseudomonas californiensis]MCD5994606.1 type VI secretion system contractile sheath small subunit [Pseudomonas californiensis]MCD6000032.1 type VI secretion system contractile sheath small subunit [Pseudomonas californiensis]
MAKEGSIAPKERVNIRFKPATGDVQQQVELPLKLLVLGDFVQRSDERKLEDRKSISVDKNNFDDVLEKQELALSLSVRNRLDESSDGMDLSVRINVTCMKDFNPANLVEQIPEMKKLMELREALMALKGPLGNTPAFRKAIESVLMDDQSRHRVLKELGLDAASEQGV